MLIVYVVTLVILIIEGTYYYTVNYKLKNILSLKGLGQKAGICTGSPRLL
jgi:hypothetical protein